MRARHERPALYWYFLLHRISGLLLTLFLPLHFLFLAEALKGAAALDGALAWTDNPLVKIAEFGLVFLLSVHLLGGLRVMALEFLPWRDGQKTLAAIAATGAVLVAGLFLFMAV